MTPFDDIWHAAYGGHIPFASCARPLRTLIDEVGLEDAKTLFRNYCRSTESKFASVASFIRKPGTLKTTTIVRKIYDNPDDNPNLIPGDPRVWQ